MRISTFLAIALASAISARGGDERPAPPRVLAIAGATVLPGLLARHRARTVIVRDGKIAGWGRSCHPRRGGGHPRGRQVGVPGIRRRRGAHIGVTGAPGAFRAGLDPRMRDLKIALACGITTAHVVEAGFAGFFGGESSLPGAGTTAIVKTTAGDLERMFIKEPAAFYLSFRSTAARGVPDARVVPAGRGAPPPRRRGGEGQGEAARPAGGDRALRADPEERGAGDRPREHRAGDPRRAGAAPRVPVRPRLSGAADGWKIAAELAVERVPVMVKARGRDSPSTSGRRVPDDGMIPIRRPGAYAEAGVRTAILPYRRGVSLDGLAGATSRRCRSMRRSRCAAA